MIPKIKRWESKKYRDWVAMLPCGNCSVTDDTIIAHHLTAIMAPHCGGAGQKASDYLTMPLCHKCHHDIHNPPSRNGFNAIQHQPTMIFNTLRLAFHHGILGETGEEGGFWSK